VNPLSSGVRLRRTWAQRLVIVFGCLAVMGTFSTAAGLAYLDTQLARLHRVSLGHVLTADDVEQGEDVGPKNFLLVGVDSEEGVADDPRFADRDGGLRADTVMLLRVDPRSERAALVSFPRDLWLPLGGTGSYDKLNAALTVGGADLLVATVSKAFAVDVHHYVQVNFAQFQDLVDVIGGVPVPFDKPARDYNTGLYVPERGCVVLDGPSALDYVRSRSLQVYEDGRWVTDPYADLSRIGRQQDFVRRALARAVSRGVRNPVTLNRLVGVGLDSVTVDDGLRVEQVLQLAQLFREFDPDELETYSLPVVTGVTRGGASIVEVQEREARPILDIFRGRGGPEDPAGVVVDVHDGRPDGDGGRRAAAALGAAGFAIGEARDDWPGVERTQVRYRAGDEAAAELVARWVDADALLLESEWLDAMGVVLVLGEDFRDVRSAPAPTTTTGPTTSAPAPDAGPGPTTTTTILGILPGAEEDLCR
jgi:polyisoprenyl-teichoic acid--peptidoglycan teichoic acid transferase